MGEFAFVFPGQGSQRVGMGKDLYEKFDTVRKIYEEASDVLGYDVAKLSFCGPKEELDRTQKTQPCLLTASVSALMVLTGGGISPAVVAGHSLGEYSALVGADVFSFRDALRVTEKRGQFMQEAVSEGEGLMAVILGLDREKLNDICRSVTSGRVYPANYNCPGQIVISGQRVAALEAMELSKKAGAKRVLALPVSVPSHCALMVPASERLAGFLSSEDIKINPPRIPVVNNADAAFLTTAEGVRESLVRQLNSPVLWEDSVMAIAGTGINTFIEVGPGTIIANLIKRIVPNARLFNIEDSAGMERLSGLR